jgi:hypothetical protein
MEKKYIPYKFPTSLSRWREQWFYIGNHHPSLPERTARALRIHGEWRVAFCDMSQIEELLGMMYTWLGRRIHLNFLQNILRKVKPCCE